MYQLLIHVLRALVFKNWMIGKKYFEGISELVQNWLIWFEYMYKHCCETKTIKIEISYVFRAPNMQNMQCMMMTGPSSVIIGGHQTKVIELEVEHKEVIREVKHIFYLYSKFSLIGLNICILVNDIFFFLIFFYFRKLDFKFCI